MIKAFYAKIQPLGILICYLKNLKIYFFVSKTPKVSFEMSTIYTFFVQLSNQL